jgi:hypothetical protein
VIRVFCRKVNEKMSLEISLPFQENGRRTSVTPFHVSVACPLQNMQTRRT